MGALPLYRHLMVIVPANQVQQVLDTGRFTLEYTERVQYEVYTLRSRNPIQLLRAHKDVVRLWSGSILGQKKQQTFVV